MIRLDNDWEFTEQWSEAFAKGESTFEKVRIPHTVKLLPLHYINPQDYQMICGYRRTLEIPSDAEGKRLFLQFDGAAHIAVVYVNGKELYTHKNGYTSFRVEISDAVRFGEKNPICVKLDTTENSSIPPFGFVIDYLTYGGIYRDVWLDIREKTYISDAWVVTPDLKTAEIRLQIDGNHEGLSAEADIVDAQDRITASGSTDHPETPFRIIAKDAACWNCENPVLYKAVIRLKKGDELIDEQERTFGFRVITLSQNEICLNGKPVFLRGLNRHQCYPYIGYAATEKLQREDAKILKEELGVNAVRTSHYPQSHYFIDECDRRGLLVFTEIPGWQHIGNSSEWKDQCVENVKEMVLQYRQHPSIILWGVRINESQDDDELYRRTNEMAHRLDDTRPTSGVRYLEKSSFLEDVYAYNDFSHDGTTPGCKPKKDVTPDVRKPLIISEANGHMYPTKSFDNSQRRQEQALRHARVLDAAMKDHEHAGCFQWCMFDYATHQDFGSGDRICYHGVMDSFRNPKPAASLYASQSDEKPVLEVTSSMDIGDYPAGQIGDFYAFTNADEVKLYKNGQYVNTFKPDSAGLRHGVIKIDDTIGNLLETNEHMDSKEAQIIRSCLLSIRDHGMSNIPLDTKLKLAYCMARYHLKFQDGYDLYGKYVANWGGKATSWRFDAVKDGKVTASVTKAPSADLHLEAKVSDTQLEEGEVYDMASIRIRILDGYGNTAPYAQLPVKIHVNNDVLEIAGDDTVTAEGGMCGCYVKTTGRIGKAEVTIETGQTEPVKIEFTVSEKEKAL